jgi:hypothetical protein
MRHYIKKLIYFLPVLVLFISSGSLLAADKADKVPGESFIDGKFFVALTTGLLALAATVYSTLKSNKQAKRIEELQAEHARKMAQLQTELDIKKESDNSKFKFLLNYDTDKVNQYMISLKEFLTVSQKAKDEVRDILDQFDHTFPADRLKQMTEIKKSMVDQYAGHVYYFNKADKEKIAHEIKNLFVDIFGLFVNMPDGFKQQIENDIDKVSAKQQLLHQEIEVEIERMVSGL